MDGVVTFAFDKDKKRMLFVKRRDVPIWVLPGGGIEKNESPKEAAIRETKEESGFDVKISRLVAEYTYKGTSKKNYVFEAVVVGGKATLSNESKAVEFFNIDDLPELRHPQISEWLSDLMKKLDKVIRREINTISYRQVLSQTFKHPFLVLRFFLMKMGIRVNI